MCVKPDWNVHSHDGVLWDIWTVRNSGIVQMDEHICERCGLTLNVFKKPVKAKRIIEELEE